MATDDDIWTLEDLAAETGLEPRTIRSYIERDLIPGASGRGRGARYAQSHVDRLKCIQKIRAAAPSLGLDDVRQVLLSLDDDRIRAIAAGDEPVVAMPLGEAAMSAPRAGVDRGRAPSRRGARPGEDDSALDYIRQVREQSRGTTGPRSMFKWSESRGRSSRRLDRLVDALKRGTGLDDAKRGPSAEMWASIAVTPDIEIRARGLDDHDLHLLEQAADFLRESLMRDLGSSGSGGRGRRPGPGKGKRRDTKGE